MPGYAPQYFRIVTTWQPLILPGLLQSADYAHALFIAMGHDSDKADDMVGARLARQHIFDRA